MTLSEQEIRIINSLYEGISQDKKLIFEDFFNKNHNKELSEYLTIDYITTDICDAIHDNILIGMYTKDVVPNLAFMTYKEMFNIIKNKMKAHN